MCRQKRREIRVGKVRSVGRGCWSATILKWETSPTSKSSFSYLDSTDSELLEGSDHFCTRVRVISSRGNNLSSQSQFIPTTYIRKTVQKIEEEKNPFCFRQNCFFTSSKLQPVSMGSIPSLAGNHRMGRLWSQRMPMRNPDGYPYLLQNGTPGAVL